MARSYTVSFTHKNKPFIAVVAAELQHAIGVYIPDESLHHILPHGRFTYDAEQGLDINKNGLTPQQSVMIDVLAAIELQTKTHHTDKV